MVKRLAALAAAVVAVLATAVPAAAATTDNFWVHCAYTGMTATIDPIVNPGSTTTAHYHDFFGNTTVDQNSTPASLQAAGTGATSCTTSTDTAAYWAPELELLPGETQTYGPAGYPCTTLANGNQACHSAYIRAYYGLGGVARTGITSIPSGMETVGGSSAATGPQPVNQVDWSCGGSTPFEQYPYDCSPYINVGNGQDGVIMRVIMPRCWNGSDPTNRANFAYPPGTGGNCPAGYTHVLPLINIRWHTGIVTPCPGQSCPAGSQVSPAFGFREADDSLMPWYQLHADFMNGWQYAPTDNPGGLDDLVKDCLITAGSCPVNPHTSPASNMPT